MKKKSSDFFFSKDQGLEVSVSSYPWSFKNWMFGSFLYPLDSRRNLSDITALAFWSDAWAVASASELIPGVPETALGCPFASSEQGFNGLRSDWRCPATGGLHSCPLFSPSSPGKGRKWPRPPWKFLKGRIPGGPTDRWLPCDS